MTIRFEELLLPGNLNSRSPVLNDDLYRGCEEFALAPVFAAGIRSLIDLGQHQPSPRPFPQ